eukprot:gene5792-6073_t
MVPYGADQKTPLAFGPWCRMVPYGADQKTTLGRLCQMVPYGADQKNTLGLWPMVSNGALWCRPKIYPWPIVPNVGTAARVTSPRISRDRAPRQAGTTDRLAKDPRCTGQWVCDVCNDPIVWNLNHANRDARLTITFHQNRSIDTIPGNDAYFQIAGFLAAGCILPNTGKTATCIERLPLEASLACSVFSQLASARLPGASGRWFDKVVLDPEASFEGERDGSKFLSALLEFEDKRDMLFRITNPKNQGLRRLRVALSCSDSMAYIKDKVIPFLRDLGCDALCSGTCKGPLLELVKQIYSLPGFLGSLRVAISAGVQLDVAPVAWLLLTLAREVEHARQDSEILDFMDPLREFAKKSGISPKALHELEVALAGSKAASGRGADFVPLEDLQSGPGGRHDNDQADYRSIKIIPTSEEVLCTRPPYLPSPDDAGEGDLQDSPEAALLDRQFRLS